LPEVGVIFGGPSPEHDVSVLTGLQAARELSRSSEYRVRGLFWSKTGDWFEVDPGLEAADYIDGKPGSAVPIQLVLGHSGGFVTEGRRPKPISVDVALVCCHGGPGEDGSLQAVLDLAGIRHAGPSVAGAALGMDKLAFAALAAGSGLPTLPRVLLDPEGEIGFPGPYIVKPRFGGSSLGIEVVSDQPTALTLLKTSPHLARGAVVEPYRSELFDLQIAVRSWPTTQLSAIERPLKVESEGVSREGEILGYRDKYAGGEGMVSAPRELPARVSSYAASVISDATMELARLGDLRGVTRVDFLSDGTGVWVNEMNTVPGSLARYLWIDPPVSFGALLRDMIEEAHQRPSLSWQSFGTDGSILKGASSIAAKLA
jgi:D-alanine-D-alanine ligase